LKIAVVGSGISGLVAGYLLQREHDVTILEADDRLGGHTNTVEVELGDARHRVDTGFIVYNEHTYPNFCKLLDELGVTTQPSDMSFSVTCERSGLEYATHSMAGLFARRRSLLDPGFLRMLAEILRFNREAAEIVDGGGDASLAEFLAERKFSRRLVDHYIVPMGAAIWSAAPDRFLRFPAVAFARFFANHGLLDHRAPIPWRVIRGGSRSYVDALTARFAGRIHTRCPVLAVRRSSDGVELLLPDGVRMRFDHVVMACHSDQALALLHDRNRLETEVLGGIAYQANEVVLHTDAAMMPRRRAAWASWNYRVVGDERDGAVLTYDMNRLQSIESSEPLLVSLNCSDRIDPSKVLRRFQYHHPVYDAATLRAQRRRHEVDGTERTHFCGAYWGNGFHEDGVVSGLEVAARFGLSL
jgi:predicted NAD/FAD-binding protein